MLSIFTSFITFDKRFLNTKFISIKLMLVVNFVSLQIFAKHLASHIVFPVLTCINKMTSLNENIDISLRLGLYSQSKPHFPYLFGLMHLKLLCTSSIYSPPLCCKIDLCNFFIIDPLTIVGLSYTFFNIFGCECWSNLRTYNPHKLKFHSTSCLFLGYSHSHKGYNCFDPHYIHLYIFCNVIFYEYQFSYKKGPLLLTVTISPVFESLHFCVLFHPFSAQFHVPLLALYPFSQVRLT